MKFTIFFSEQIICKYIKIGYIKDIERGEFMSYIYTLKKRRSVYNLNNTLSISEDTLINNIEQILLESPTAFHMQSPYILILMNKEHEKLWNITTNILKQRVPIDKFKSTQNLHKVDFELILFLWCVIIIWLLAEKAKLEH